MEKADEILFFFCFPLFFFLSFLSRREGKRGKRERNDSLQGGCERLSAFDNSLERQRSHRPECRKRTSPEVAADRTNIPSPRPFLVPTRVTAGNKFELVLYHRPFAPSVRDLFTSPGFIEILCGSPMKSGTELFINDSD